ncbi:hypothetical protein I546_0122 [Mycobacterium kansasii 732]|nr:hypothetical protein I546_0122 [Mycobacterium kansasii 732]
MINRIETTANLVELLDEQGVAGDIRPAQHRTVDGSEFEHGAHDGRQQPMNSRRRMSAGQRRHHQLDAGVADRVLLPGEQAECVPEDATR